MKIIKLVLGCRDALINKVYYHVLEERPDSYLLIDMQSGDYFTLNKSKIGIPLQHSAGKVYYVIDAEMSQEEERKVKEIEAYIKEAIVYRNHLESMIERFKEDIEKVDTLINEANQKLENLRR